MINGTRRGYMSLDELIRLAPVPSTPVWRQGLEDWCMLSSLPELRGGECVPPMPPAPPVVPAVPVPPMNPVMPPPQAMYQPAVPPQQPQQGEPMPPTYLAWSIVVMLLCCIVPGIVALVYSTKVSSRFSMGDYAGAKAASENAAIWIIVTVVCGIIAVPFQILLSLI